MKATRKLVSMPLVDAPEGLEERILAAATEAQKVVPIRSRMSGAVSWAGAWAMRPQTAMAAVFLLMIGSTTMLLRTRSDGRSASRTNVTVTQHGEPAVENSPSPAADGRFDLTAAN